MGNGRQIECCPQLPGEEKKTETLFPLYIACFRISFSTFYLFLGNEHCVVKSFSHRIGGREVQKCLLSRSQHRRFHFSKERRGEEIWLNVRASECFIFFSFKVFKCERAGRVHWRSELEGHSVVLFPLRKPGWPFREFSQTLTGLES